MVNPDTKSHSGENEGQSDSHTPESPERDRGIKNLQELRDDFKNSGDDFDSIRAQTMSTYDEWDRINKLLEEKEAEYNEAKQGNDPGRESQASLALDTTLKDLNEISKKLDDLDEQANLAWTKYDNNHKEMRNGMEERYKNLPFWKIHETKADQSTLDNNNYRTENIGTSSKNALEEIIQRKGSGQDIIVLKREGEYIIAIKQPLDNNTAELLIKTGYKETLSDTSDPFTFREQLDSLLSQGKKFEFTTDKRLFVKE